VKTLEQRVPRKKINNCRRILYVRPNLSRCRCCKTNYSTQYSLVSHRLQQKQDLIITYTSSMQLLVLRFGQPAVITATVARGAVLVTPGSAEINSSCLLSICDARAFSLGSGRSGDLEHCLRFMCQTIIHTRHKNRNNLTKTAAFRKIKHCYLCVFCYRDFLQT
jgi:hypothetical protein